MDEHLIRVNQIDNIDNEIDKVVKNNKKLTGYFIGDEDSEKYIPLIEKGIDVVISKDELLNVDFKDITNCIDTVNKRGYKVYFSVDNDIEKESNLNSPVNYIFTEEQLNLLEKIDTYLKNKDNQTLRINEFYAIDKPYIVYESGWKVSTMIYINERLNKIVDYIKDNDFSPFEAMLYIHKYVSTFIYDKGDDLAETGRVLPSIFKKRHIVCSGYASLVKAIIDRLDNPDLKANIVGVDLVNNKDHLHHAHCNNLIKIKDDKYAIKGIYLEDACFDAKSKKDYEKGFAYCLYPVSDSNHFIHNDYVNKSNDSRLFNLVYSNNTDYDKNDVFSTYKYKGKAIELETYRKALEVVFYAKYKDRSKAKRIANAEINKSKDESIKNFDADSKNTFVNAVKTKRSRRY